MKKAAILMHNPLSVMGGMERFNAYLRDFLVEEDYQVELFDQTQLHVSSFARRYWNPWVVYQVGKGLKLSGFDIILTVGFAGGWASGPQVFNICFGTVKTYLEAIEAWSPKNKKLLWEMFWCLQFDRWGKKRQQCIAASQQVKNELERDYQIPSTVIPCGINTRHFRRNPEAGRAWRSRLGISAGQIVGAFAGRWAPNHKGLDTLMTVIKKRPDIHWMLATDGTPDLTGVPHTLQKVAYDNLPAFYSTADFSIQLSRYESYGFSFVESLACGTPAISTPVGITPEIYNEPLLSDLLIPHPASENTAKIHQAIDRLKDPAFYENVSRRIVSKTAENYSLETWKKNMRALLNQSRS